MKLPAKLKRFFDVLGAVVAGGVVTGLLVWLIADVMGVASMVLGYALTGVFVILAAIFYRVVARLTRRTPGLVFVIVAAVAVLMAFVLFNAQALGVDDPFVPLLILAAAVGLGYFFTGGTGSARS